MRFVIAASLIVFINTPSVFAQTKDSKCNTFNPICRGITGAKTERNAFNQAEKDLKQSNKVMDQQIKVRNETCGSDPVAAVKHNTLSDGVNDLIKRKDLGTTACERETTKLNEVGTQHNKIYDNEVQKKKEYEDAKKRTGAWR